MTEMPRSENRSQPNSPWPAASLLCSIAVCCPAMSVLGIFLGLRALVQIKANPTLPGKRLAKTGIAIGSLATVGWICGLIWWQFNARIPMMRGPQVELLAGGAGEIAKFKSGFIEESGGLQSAEAAEFLRELATRYGQFVDSGQSIKPQSKAALVGPAELRATYTLRFENQSVEAEAVFVTFAPARVIPRPIFKWKWIRVIDPLRGDLVYPVRETAAATSPPIQSAPPPPPK